MSVGRHVKWETGGTTEIGLTVDTAGTCCLWIENWKEGEGKELGFEMTPGIASELIAQLAAWIALEADGYERLWKEAETKLEATP